jgi:hypothetical protein
VIPFWNSADFDAMTTSFPPPALANPNQLDDTLQARGYAVLDPNSFANLAGCDLAQLNDLKPQWNLLPPDTYLKDGGRYRRRRHSCFVVDGVQVTQVAHRPHWQPVEYNALHGGMQRWFEPMQSAMVGQAAWRQLLVWLGRVASQHKLAQPWFVEAHQFRIDTTDGIGRPTPEGAHRDGVDLVAVFMVDRAGIKGGETRVFDAAGPNGQRFTLTQSWSLLLLDDARVIHESTPIQPTGQPGEPGHRDTLVVTLRGGGFQGDAG